MIGLIEWEKMANDTARTPKERDYARIKMYELKMKESMNRKYELEKALSLIVQLELELVEDDKIEDGGYESRLIEQIKEILYKESAK